MITWMIGLLATTAALAQEPPSPTVPKPLSPAEAQQFSVDPGNSPATARSPQPAPPSERDTPIAETKVFQWLGERENREAIAQTIAVAGSVVDFWKFGQVLAAGDPVPPIIVKTLVMAGIAHELEQKWVESGFGMFPPAPPPERWRGWEEPWSPDGQVRGPDQPANSTTLVEGDLVYRPGGLVPMPWLNGPASSGFSGASGGGNPCAGVSGYCQVLPDTPANRARGVVGCVQTSSGTNCGGARPPSTSGPAKSSQTTTTAAKNQSSQQMQLSKGSIKQSTVNTGTTVKSGTSASTTNSAATKAAATNAASKAANTAATNAASKAAGNAASNAANRAASNAASRAAANAASRAAGNAASNAASNAAAAAASRR